MTPWNQVAIIGTGLIGGSLGLALRGRGLAARVVGVGHRQGTLDEARRRGVADATSLDPLEGVRGSDLVVLATAPGLFRDILQRARPGLAPGAVVIDVGSTKADVVRTCEALMPDGAAFVGCHPIAGSERRGVTHASADLFEGATCVVTPTEKTPQEALERVIATWLGLGMTVRRLSPDEHDRLLAQVSHLPHLVAAALVQAAGDKAEPLIGPGWADTTRVASGDPELWRDILMTNATEVAGAIEGFERVVAAFRDALRQGDGARLQSLLAESKSRRDRLTRKKEGR